MLYVLFSKNIWSTLSCHGQILDELIIAGELQESSKKSVLRVASHVVIHRRPELMLFYHPAFRSLNLIRSKIKKTAKTRWLVLAHEAGSFRIRFHMASPPITSSTELFVSFLLGPSHIRSNSTFPYLSQPTPAFQLIEAELERGLPSVRYCATAVHWFISI